MSNSVSAFGRFTNWFAGEADSAAKGAVKFGHKVGELEDWAEAILQQGVDKYIRQPKRPAPVYAFPTAEEKQHNFRDVAVSAAGAKTADGRKLKPGVLTRMDAPREGDRARFEGKVEIDLRSAGELKKDTAPSWRNTPGFGYQSFPIAGLGAYNSLGGVPIAREVLRNRDLAYARTMLLVQQGNKVVIHCTHGVDRTGMDVGFLMLALGYDKAAALNEYLISGQSPEGPQTDPEMFNDAIKNTLADHGGTIEGYVSYLNGLLKENGVAGKIDLTQLRAAALN
jgi:hypothetical protein